MKKYLIKLFVACLLAFAATLVPNDSYAQLPDGAYMDFWNHQTPQLSVNGDVLSTYLYPEGGRWYLWWKEEDYIVTALIKYENTGDIFRNVECGMHSSGVYVRVPPRPRGGEEATVIITLEHKRNLHPKYEFLSMFEQYNQ